MSNAKVDVVIPTYNRSDLLERAINSVLNQTFENFKLIIVDDKSTDDTADLINQYNDERVVFLQHSENTGHGGVARNTGIEHGESEYVAFLDDDDVWLPTKLEKQVELLDSLSHRYGLIYCWMDYYNQGKIVTRRYRRHRGDIFEEMLDQNAITSASTILIRRTVLDEVGTFDTALYRGCDSDFIRRVARKYLVDFIPEPLVKYHTNHGYSRDSDEDEEGKRNAIEAGKAKLSKFETELKKYPKRKARIYSNLGRRYSQINDIDNSVTYYLKAIQTSPLTTSVYMDILRTVRNIAIQQICFVKKRIQKLWS
jgi:glycosyltransferase involved in cell wall biosynthesis